MTATPALIDEIDRKTELVERLKTELPKAQDLVADRKRELLRAEEALKEAEAQQQTVSSMLYVNEERLMGLYRDAYFATRTELVAPEVK